MRAIYKNGKTAFTFGALVLARDEGKEEGDICEEFVPEHNGENLVYTVEKPEKGEQLRITLACKDNKKVRFTDYASCGKNWATSRNRVSVWLNAR